MTQLLARHLRVIDTIADEHEAMAKLVSIRSSEHSFDDLMSMPAGQFRSLRQDVMDELSPDLEVSVLESGWSVELPEPRVNAYGQTVEAIDIRLPTVRDLVVRGMNRGYDKSRAILSRISGMTVKEIDELPAGQFRFMVELVQDYVTTGDDDDDDTEG